MKSTSTPAGPRDPNQGEGDRRSARHYNQNLREFIAGGKVDDAARDAARYFEGHPEDALRAERVARRGPRARVSVDELVAKSRTMLDRVRPIVERIIDRFRTRRARRGMSPISSTR